MPHRMGGDPAIVMGIKLFIPLPNLFANHKTPEFTPLSDSELGNRQEACTSKEACIPDHESRWQCRSVMPTSGDAHRHDRRKKGAHQGDRYRPPRTQITISCVKDGFQRREASNRRFHGLNKIASGHHSFSDVVLWVE